MIDRNGSFSPKENERGSKATQGGSLLTEASFIARSKEEKDETREVISSISEISFVLRNTTLSTKVSNLRSGITNPIIDHMMMNEQNERDISTRRHKENVLAFGAIRRAVERSSEKNTASVTGTMRETFYGMTKSVTSAISTIITPIVKTIGAGLFGSKKERSVVQAVDDQTQFLRSGRILDNSTIFSRTMQRGLVGSVLTGVSAMAGIGNKTAQSAEDKRSAGQALNFGEKLTTTLGVQLGWFKNFDRKDTKKTFDKNNPEEVQASMLDRIRLGIESFLGHYQSVSQIFLNEFVDSHNILQRQTSVLKQAIELASHTIADRIEYANSETLLTYRDTARLESSNMSYYNSRQNNILADVKDELVQSNNPMPSEYQYRALYIQNQQYEELQKANELAKQAAEDAKPKQSGGGGLIGMAVSLGKLLFNSKTAAVIAGLGKKFIITPVMGAIKAGGSWIARNGFKLMLRVPFAKVFAIAGITTLLYKYMLRPMIDWFDDTFQTDIGGAIDRFGNLISDKFTGMLDWIREKMAKVPVLGRFFKKDDKIPEVPESQKEKKRGGASSLYSSTKDAAVSTYESSKEMVGGLAQFYKKGWGNMVDMVDPVGSFVQNGIDRLRGYDPDGLDDMRARSLNTGQIAQDAFGNMMNPAAPQSVTITDDMAMAALESRDAALQQVNEMKEQRKVIEEQNQKMIDILNSVAGNTHQGAMATFMATKANQFALKNQYNTNIDGMD